MLYSLAIINAALLRLGRGILFDRGRGGGRLRTLMLVARRRPRRADLAIGPHAVSARHHHPLLLRDRLPRALPHRAARGRRAAARASARKSAAASRCCSSWSRTRRQRPRRHRRGRAHRSPPTRRGARSSALVGRHRQAPALDTLAARARARLAADDGRDRARDRRHRRRAPRTCASRSATVTDTFRTRSARSTSSRT